MKYQYFFALITLLFAFSSCEDVIVLDLEESPQQPVIEATLNAAEGTCQVLIAKSNGFYDTNDFEKITNATIQLTADSGEEYTFSETNAGEYHAENILVTSGQAFSIKVTGSDNTIYKATAQVPFPVVLDSLESIENTGGIMGNDNSETQYNIFLNWTDLANEVNFYRAKVTANGQYLAADYFLYVDENQDGEDIRTSLNRTTFNEGDVVQVELVAIGKATYKYFSDLSTIQGSGFDATTPFNPKSNFDNNALGYFGIEYSDVKDIVIE